MSTIVLETLAGVGLFTVGVMIGRLTPPFPWMTKHASGRRWGRYQQGGDVLVPARVHVLDPPRSRKPREFWGNRIHRTERLLFDVSAGSAARPRDWLEGYLGDSDLFFQSLAEDNGYRHGYRIYVEHELSEELLVRVEFALYDYAIVRMSLGDVE